MFILTIASLLPVALLMVYIYKRDTFQKEPWPLLLKAFGFGILSALPAVFIAEGFSHVFPVPTNAPFWAALHDSFLLAAIPEEFCKLLMLYLCIWKNPHFDEYYDGLEYAAFLGLGFAGLENLLYVYQYGLGVAFLRGVLSVPGHFFFAIFMGYFFAMARFKLPDRKKFLALAFAVPVLLHGIFDFLIMYGENLDGDSNVTTGEASLVSILYVIFFAFFFFVWRAATKRVKEISGQ